MALLPVDQLPRGFRFHPTDPELINHYLKRKINGRINSDACVVIPEVDVCKCEPWDLPAKSVIRSEDPEWFFFTPLDRKHANGARHNRATVAGYWKATGKDRMINSRGGGAATTNLIGMKKTLVFYRGRAPRGKRTNWIMHEYRTVEPEFESGEQGQFVLCRLFKKLEENNPSTNADEVERGGFSPAPTRSSPSDTQADASEEFGTLQRRPPESKLQENSQALPVSAANWPVCCHNDAADFLAASDVWDHVVAEYVQPQFIGEHCSNVSSPLPAPGEDFQFYYPGSSKELLQDADAELDSFVNSLICNQVEDVSKMFDDFADRSVPSYQVCPTSTEPPKLCQFSGTSSLVETEPVLAQAQYGFINPPANEEINNSVSRERSAQLNLISNAGSWDIMQFQSKDSILISPNNFVGGGSVQNPTSTLDDSATRASRTLNGIRIRYHQPHLSSNITNREQGSAARRIRLQSCKSEVPAMDSIPGSNKNYGVVKALSKEVAGEREVPGPNLDELEDFSDHDNSTSTDIAATPAEPSVRLRKKSTDDTGNELEGKSTHPRTPKHCSVSVLGMMLSLLFILLLSVGSWYYFYL